ncbi:alkaline phosphatase family protein [Pedobacter gandavensis]|uniref:alkaline phosphatase family protein n=1 Tax=Pedobacter gandavensis TaxID=2679963 RepID=UPI00292CDD1F|nr:alkaline phosphatase family protein [Pedobacter gandavensis]
MKIRIDYMISAIIALMMFTSCKKYPNPDPVFEELVNNVAPQRKVLVISIDGLTGTELQAVAPVNIAELQKNSKYSYNTLATASDAAGWVSMVTGTSFSKHQIVSDDFEKNVDPDEDEHGTITVQRNVFDYITQYRPVKTALVTPWANLREYIKNTDFSPVVSTDLAAKDSAVHIIQTQQGLGAVFVNFRAVESAGDDGGFVASNPNYKNAIVKSDEYVGHILAAVKARKNYSKEDWLIIITSNHGGSNDQPSNGFTIAYNPAFRPLELKKSGFNSVLFNSATTQAIVPDDHGLYNMGADQDFTVQMQVKFAKVTSNNGFLSKSNDASTNFTGWMWYQSSGGNMTMSAGGNLNGAPTGRVNLTTIGPVSDNTWHTVTMTVKRINATTRTMTAYVDGVLKGTPVNIHNRLSISSEEPLKIGKKTVDGVNAFSTLNSANLLIFNTALDPTTISANVSLKDVTKHPNYQNLIGYWPMDEGAESVYYNKAPQGYNMSLSGAYSWASLTDNYPPGTVSEPILSNLSIPTTVSDVAALSLYWMKIDILSDFNYDGKPYLNNFEREFLK